MKKIIITVKLLSLSLVLLLLAIQGNAALESAGLDQDRSDKIWANQLSNFIHDIGNVSVEPSQYSDVPSTTLEISDLLDCSDSKVVFIVHFLSTGKYVTQFRLPGKEISESVRLIAEQLRTSESGSDKELEAGRILRTQAYISRIVPLVDEDPQSQSSAARQRELIQKLCKDPSLVKEFLDRIKPQKDNKPLETAGN